jgi:hypothetical protein
MSGTASDNNGVTQVTWANDRGGSGIASGTTSWTVSGILLQPGTNILTVAARDAAGNTATATLAVTLVLLDLTPPTITITSPTAGVTYNTNDIMLTLVGTATDNVGVTQVTWVNARGGSGTATGTTSWTVDGIILRPGTNIITVTARDAAGNTATATLVVTFSFRFTDDPLLPGMQIKAVHFIELRSAVDLVRSIVGLPGFDWTDPTLTPEITPARVVYLTALRTALDQAYLASVPPQPPPVYTDPTLAPGITIIKADHVNDLRRAVNSFN